MSISIQNISKNFGGFRALDDVSLEIPGGGLVALLGPSGCGKTTLLRIIAGLERADSGRILFDGEDASSRDVRDQRVGFVFQHYALFRHMSVFENVAFGLRVKPKASRKNAEEIRERVHALLRLVQLDWAGERFPSQLSGGQRQRVALARALAVEPKVLLLDEPFGALDAKVRRELRRWLRKLHNEIHVTSVFVTHDQEEALEVSDKVAVLNRGRVEQYGAPYEVYHKPATQFVHEFLGHTNQLDGFIERGRARFGEIEVAALEYARVERAPAVGYVRPFDLDVRTENNGGASIPARISYVYAIGPLVRLECERDGDGARFEAEMVAQKFEALNVSEGSRVFLAPKNIRVFSAEAAPAGDQSRSAPGFGPGEGI
ncbi:MAG: Sulfate/thiosulfate import ATP-binding protein CysA [Myxococcota bacterium]|nr:Sulfate/thiosulfate import ATP-binding protein CysA [Myxococcota bacterium]